MKTTKLFFASIIILCAIVLAPCINAQTDALKNSVTAQDLGVKDQKVLPGNVFYFLKNWTRGIQLLLTFDNVKKLELVNKFANEKLIELNKLVQNNANPTNIGKAADNYTKEIEKVKEIADKITSTSQSDSTINSFLDKFTQQNLLQEEMLQKIASQVPVQIYQKIEGAETANIEKFGQVMEKLDAKENLGARISNQVKTLQGDDYNLKGIRAVQALDGLQNGLSGQIQSIIQEVKDQSVQDIGKSVQTQPIDIQNQITDYIQIWAGGAVQKLNTLETIKVDAPATKAVVNQIIETVLAKIQEENVGRSCPLIALPITNFCPNGRLKTISNGTNCVTAFECLISSNDDESNCIPVCSGIGTGSEGWYSSCDQDLIKYDTCKNCKATCKNIGTKSEGLYNSCSGELIKWTKCSEKPVVCPSVYSPVCGKNGNSYDNECFATNAGTTVASQGKCKPQCTIDTDCPALVCAKAPCYKNRCIANKCKLAECAINSDCTDTTKICVEYKCVSPNANANNDGNNAEPTNNNSTDNGGYEPTNNNSTDNGGYEPREGTPEDTTPFIDTGELE